jgi:Lanthionine synthetase C-like protein
MLWRREQHEPLTDEPWDELLARDAISAIVADTEASARGGFWPGHPLDDLAEDERVCSLYLGTAGMVWALAKLGSAVDLGAIIDAAIERYRAVPDFAELAHPPSLWMGETGLRVVAAAIGSRAGDRQRVRELVRANREHPTWELMWGSPGTMLAARALQLEDEWEESAELLWGRWDRASELWAQELYGHVRHYLGPAHGFAGNVHALRGYVSDDVLRARVTRLLERLGGRADGLVNWPPSLDETPSKMRVQWCHGAPGIVSTLGDLMPQELALGAGELIWTAGPLRKGAGLCHGTAGNGFAFLRLHELTRDERWLERARHFAMHAIEQVDRHKREFGRGRYTLWTGDIGVALYLRACLDGVAAFPTIDGF